MPTLADLVQRVRIVHETPGAAEAAQKIRDVASAQREVQKASVGYESVGKSLTNLFNNSGAQTAIATLGSIRSNYIKNIETYNAYNKLLVEQGQAEKSLSAFQMQRMAVMNSLSQAEGLVPSALKETALGAVAMGVAYLGAAAAIAYLVKNAADAVAAFSKFEQQQVTTQNLLQATGAASGKTAEQIERLAKTFADVNDARQATQALLQFTSVSGDTFDRAMKAAANLSATGFGNLTQSAKAVGQALQDPVNGLKSLGTVADTFSFQQLKVIQSLYETGHAAEAQRAILAALEQKLGGSAAAQAGTLSGAWAAVAKQTQLGSEQFGAAIVKITGLTTAVQALASGLELLNSIDTTRVLRGIVGLASVALPFGAGFGARQLVAAVRGGGGDQEETLDQARARAVAELAAKLREEKNAYDEVVAAINKRIESGRKDEVQTAIETELVKSRTSADSTRGNEIARLVTQEYAEKEARKAAAEAARKAAADEERAATLRAQRLLQNEQTLAQAQLEIQLINATSGAAAEARANLQAYYKIKADAARTHGVFDEREYAAAKKTNAELGKLVNQREMLAQVSQAIEGPLVSGLADIATGSKKAGDAFRATAQTILRSIEEIIIKLLIVQPLMQAITGGLGGSAAGGFSLARLFGNAYGNVFQNGNPIRFDMGGVVSQPTIFQMANGGLASMAENEPEAVMPLRRLPSGRLGVEAIGRETAQSITIGDTSIVINGNADDRALMAIKRELAEHRRAIAQQVRAARGASHQQRTGVWM